MLVYLCIFHWAIYFHFWSSFLFLFLCIQYSVLLCIYFSRFPYLLPFLYSLSIISITPSLPYSVHFASFLSIPHHLSFGFFYLLSYPVSFIFSPCILLFPLLIPFSFSPIAPLSYSVSFAVSLLLSISCVLQYLLSSLWSFASYLSYPYSGFFYLYPSFLLVFALLRLLSFPPLQPSLSIGNPAVQFSIPLPRLWEDLLNHEMSNFRTNTSGNCRFSCQSLQLSAEINHKNYCSKSNSTKKHLPVQSYGNSVVLFFNRVIIKSCI